MQVPDCLFVIMRAPFPAKKCNEWTARYTSKVELVNEEELCRTMAPRIRLYGLRHLRDEQAAADLVQQVLMITIESVRAGKVRDPEKIESFILGTCRMTVLEIRRGSSRRERLLDQYYVPAVSVSPEPLQALDQPAECLARLADRERSALVMTSSQEHSSAAGA